MLSAFAIFGIGCMGIGAGVGFCACLLLKPDVLDAYFGDFY